MCEIGSISIVEFPIPDARGTADEGPSGAITKARSRVCLTCRLEKPIRRFYRDARIASGYRGTCVDCAKARWGSHGAAPRVRRPARSTESRGDLGRAKGRAREADPPPKALRDEWKAAAARIRAERLAKMASGSGPGSDPIRRAILDYRRAWRAIVALRGTVVAS